MSYYGTMERPIKYSGKNRYLVMARVGESSLHQQWLEPSKFRNFDIFLEYYGDGRNNFRNDCDFYSEAKETKWPRLYKIFEELGNEIFQYDAVWIPDDDISTDCTTIHKLFEMFMDYELLLAQPALTRSSYYSHRVTLVNGQYLLRYTKFVEVMAPIFSRNALQSLWKTFGESKSGWGLDSIWPMLLGYPNDKIAIIDQFPVKHTRPVGGGTLYDDTGHSEQEELERICQAYGVYKKFDYRINGGVKTHNRKKSERSFVFKNIVR